MNLKALLKVVLAGFLAIAAQTSFAASQDECAEWICLPGGFPSGCGGAYNAMINRINHQESALPDFGECAVNPPQGSGSHMTFTQGQATYVPAQQQCSTDWFGNPSNCTNVSAHYVQDAYCNLSGDSWTGTVVSNDSNNGLSCTLNTSYIEVQVDGTKTGSTYFWGQQVNP